VFQLFAASKHERPEYETTSTLVCPNKHTQNIKAGMQLDDGLRKAFLLSRC